MTTVINILRFLKRLHIMSSVLLLCICSFICASPIYAADDSTRVEVTVPSSFTVIIPKSIMLDGSQWKPTQNFNVTVTGDLDGLTSVHVTSDPSFEMSQMGKKSVSVNVGYDQSWLSSDMGQARQGSVSVQDELSAGKYTGSFNFYINTEEVPHRTLTFSAGGHALDPVKLRYGENEVKVDDWEGVINAPENMHFVGWATSPDGEAMYGEGNLGNRWKDDLNYTDEQVNADISPDFDYDGEGNLDLYAVYAMDCYTVTAEDNGYIDYLFMDGDDKSIISSVKIDGEVLGNGKRVSVGDTVEFEPVFTRGTLDADGVHYNYTDGNGNTNTAWYGTTADGSVPLPCYGAVDGNIITADQTGNTYETKYSTTDLASQSFAYRHKYQHVYGLNDAAPWTLNGINITGDDVAFDNSLNGNKITIKMPANSVNAVANGSCSLIKLSEHTEHKTYSGSSTSRGGYIPYVSIDISNSCRESISLFVRIKDLQNQYYQASIDVGVTYESGITSSAIELYNPNGTHDMQKTYSLDKLVPANTVLSTIKAINIRQYTTTDPYSSTEYKIEGLFWFAD